MVKASAASTGHKAEQAQSERGANGGKPSGEPSQSRAQMRFKASSGGCLLTPAIREFSPK